MSSSYASPIFSTSGSSRYPRAARLDRRAPSLLHADETAALEELQTLANDGAAEAELFAQRRLGRKHVARSENAADDLVAKRLEDDRREPRRPLLQVCAALGHRLDRAVRLCRLHAGHHMV